MRYSYHADRIVLCMYLGRDLKSVYELEAVIHWYFQGLTPKQIFDKIGQREGYY